MITKADAILIIESSRASHISWVAWYVKYPEDQEKFKEAGDKAFHEECIAGYDKVLEFLRTIPS